MDNNVKTMIEIMKEEGEKATKKRLAEVELESKADKELREADAKRVAEMRARLAKEGELTKPVDGAVEEGKKAKK